MGKLIKTLDKILNTALNHLFTYSIGVSFLFLIPFVSELGLVTVIVASFVFCLGGAATLLPLIGLIHLLNGVQITPNDASPLSNRSQQQFNAYKKRQQS